MKDIGGLFFLLCVAFVLISLLTYDPADSAGVRYPANDPPANKGGRLGADLAYALLANLGAAAYVLVSLAGFWAFVVFFRRRLDEIYLKLIATTVTVLASATLLSLQSWMGASDLGLAGTAPGAGGVYGAALEALLVQNFGGVGALLCVLLALSISVVLATDWLIYTGTLRGWEMVKSSVRRIRVHFSPEGRENRAREQKERARVECARVIGKQRQASPVRPRPVAPSLPTHQPPRRMAPYEQPPLNLFEDHVERIHGLSGKEIKQRKDIIEETLREYGIEVEVVNHEVGPSVTIYELALSPGTPIHAVVARQNEISMRLAVPPVRVVGPIPGKDTVGVEVPNPFPDTVRMREFLEKDYKRLRKIPLPVLLGKTNSGDPIIRSLTEMPHMLIAGTTGSGKSVCLKSIVTSLIAGMSWDEMKLIVIDPKMVELTVFTDIPHLWAPVVTCSKKAALVLDWLVTEMDDRYRLLNRVGARDIQSFNRLGAKKVREKLVEAGEPEEVIEQLPKYLPYIVVVIDELADLMMTARKEVETSIIRISQKARAVGIHVVAATQRPSADVLTGLIRSNMPSRVAFRVASSIESRIILDIAGAERLLGKGDMLVRLQGAFSPVRAQCTYVGERELSAVVSFLRSKGKPEYREELVEIDTMSEVEGTSNDSLFEDAVNIVLQEQRGSVSLIQRKLSVGYTRSARLVDEMEKFGIVGKAIGAGKEREVLVTPEQWAARKSAR